MREGVCSVEPRTGCRGNAQQTLEHLEEAELDSKLRNAACLFRLLQASAAGTQASELGCRGPAHQALPVPFRSFHLGCLPALFSHQLCLHGLVLDAGVRGRSASQVRTGNSNMGVTFPGRAILMKQQVSSTRVLPPYPPPAGPRHHWHLELDNSWPVHYRKCSSSPGLCYSMAVAHPPQS